MSSSTDKRASERIPITDRVRVVMKGRTVIYAVAINISMGGILLTASPSLRPGSPCEVVVLKDGDAQGKALAMEGTVVRADAHGTAIQFRSPLEEESYRALASPTGDLSAASAFGAYRTYFKVSQNEGFEGCEAAFGVSPKTFRTVFLTTFFTCIPLAILPVWLFKGSLPPYPNWAKVGLSFGYGAFWLLVIQPTVDLAVFRILRNRDFDSTRA